MGFGSLAPLFAPIPAQAAAEPPPTDHRIGAAILCNLENNLTLVEKEADRILPPASTAKIMAGLLACRALADRQTETVTVTSAMLTGVTGRKMGLKPDEQLPLRDLLYAAICGSYNDAMHVLSVLSAGSVVAFVEDMNREAERLNTAHTRYTNPTGLDDPAMQTTARDVSLIAREAYENPLYMAISSTRTYTIEATNQNPARTITNRNALISDSSRNYYNGFCRGMNAGMTDAGGWCVVTVCEQGGASNLCIVMGAADAPADELVPAYLYTNRLLSWANRNYRYRTILPAGSTVDTVHVGMTGVSKSRADVVTRTDLNAYLPTDADAEADLDRHFQLTDGELTAPLTAGQSVGTVTVHYQGHLVGKSDLTVTEDFARNGFLDAMLHFRGYLTSRAFWSGAVICVILLLIYRHMTTGPNGRYGLRDARRHRPRKRRPKPFRRSRRHHK